MTIYAHAFWAWFPFRRRAWVSWLVLGAVLPDLPYCLSFALAVARRGPHAIGDLGLWEELWRSPATCALHSFVPWSLTTLLFLGWLWASWRSGARSARPPAGKTTFSSKLGALLAGWGSHVVVDMLTHRSDGYPILWPLSDYRFPTRLSYWEPAYHGRLFALVCDGGILLALGWLAWQRLRAAPPAR
jgi:Domain of unknown function (DUF4184)